MPILFLVSGSTWTVPADFDPDNNLFEVIGAGGNGGGSGAGNGTGWCGGGGGAYTKIANLALDPFSILDIHIAAAGSQLDTTLKNGLGAIVLSGAPGMNADQFNAGTGGDNSLCIPSGPANFGGDGGVSDVGTGGGGGGGAAGPLGPGNSGGSPSNPPSHATGAGGGGSNGGSSTPGDDGSSAAGGFGGEGTAGTGSGVGATASTDAVVGTSGAGGGGGFSAGHSLGAAGGTDTSWDVSHGASGGGGGGGTDALGVNVSGGNGGTYGGGGGGAGTVTGSGNVAGGIGGQGIIVVTYRSTDHPSLESKLRTAAMAFPALVALLTNSPSIPLFPDFRWYDTTFLQGSVFPAVVVQLVSGGQVYSNYQRLSTSFNRVQFMIWDVDAERARRVEQALYRFLDQFNPAGLDSNLTNYPNTVLMTMQKQFPQSEPPKFMRLNDVSIFDDQAVG